MPSGCRRLRTESASMPSPRRSPSRSSATPSSRLSRSPPRTFFATASAMAMEPQLRDPFDEAEGARPPVELPQPAQLFFTQVVDDVPPQVRLALRPAPRTEAIVLRGDLRQGPLAGAQRLLQPGDARLVDGSGAAGPKGKDEGQARARLPFLSQVEALGLPAKVEGGVADDERRIGRGEHVLDGRAHGEVLGIVAEPLTQEDLRQGHAGARRSVEGDEPHALQPPAVEQVHRSHRSAARDRDPGHDRVVPRGILHRGDHAEVDLAGVETLRDARRHVADEGEARIGLQPVHERHRVQVRHHPQPEGPIVHHSRTTLNTVSRSIGRRPASRIRRTSSWTVRTCGVFAPASWAIFSSVTVPSMSSAPKERPTWARRGPIMIQYDFTWGKLSSISRPTAMAFRSSKAVVSGQSIAGASHGWKASGM